MRRNHFQRTPADRVTVRPAYVGQGPVYQGGRAAEARGVYAGGWGGRGRGTFEQRPQMRGGKGGFWVGREHRAAHSAPFPWRYPGTAGWGQGRVSLGGLTTPGKGTGTTPWNRYSSPREGVPWGGRGGVWASRWSGRGFQWLTPTAPPAHFTQRQWPPPSAASYSGSAVGMGPLQQDEWIKVQHRAGQGFSAGPHTFVGKKPSWAVRNPWEVLGQGKCWVGLGLNGRSIWGGKVGKGGVDGKEGGGGGKGVVGGKGGAIGKGDCFGKGIDGGKGVGSGSEGNRNGSNLSASDSPWRKALLNKVSLSEAPSAVGQWNEGWGRSGVGKAVAAGGVRFQGRNCTPYQALSRSAHRGTGTEPRLGFWVADLTG